MNRRRGKIECVTKFKYIHTYLHVHSISIISKFIQLTVLNCICMQYFQLVRVLILMPKENQFFFILIHLKEQEKSSFLDFVYFLQITLNLVQNTMFNVPIYFSQ